MQTTQSAGKSLFSFRFEILGLFLLSACLGGVKEAPSVDTELIKLELGTMHLETSSVGIGKFKAPATFALIDVVNQAKLPVDLTLGGTLLNDNNEVVGEFRHQWLRMPSEGGRRTFALVDNKQEAHPDAIRAEIKIVKATEATHPMGVVVEDGHVFDDRGRVVVTGFVVNTTERDARAIVIASFYDKRGAPIQRPSTHITLDRGQKRGMQFVGPEGSTSATLYIGEVLF